MPSIRLLAAIVLCAVTACARPAQRPLPAAPASIPNLSAVKQDIRNYRSSGRWEADIRQVADECLAFAEGARGTVARPAVVFEIDETLLSNWQYEVDNDFARSIPLFRPAGYESPSIVPFKSGERAKIEQQGYTIVANIGDQESDLEDGHALHVCKVPNPEYLIP
jgi:hypothetical protein